MENERCSQCGRYKKHCDLKEMQAEGDETWLTCIDCMSQSELADHERAMEDAMSEYCRYGAED